VLGGLFSSALLVLPVCAQAQRPVAVSALREQNTAAFRAVVQLHAVEMARLPGPSDAGIWLVQDSNGRLISSGVLRRFPTDISSRNYGRIVPGAAGQRAIDFGFARTPVLDRAGPFRVAYVTVAAPQRRRAS